MTVFKDTVTSLSAISNINHKWICQCEKCFIYQTNLQDDRHLNVFDMLNN